MPDEPPKRRFPAHPPVNWKGDRPVIVFVTVCTAGRRRILNDARIHDHLIEIWNSSDTWLVGRYLLMPDHVHLFCGPRSRDAPSVADWVAFWKSRSAAGWPDSMEGKVWHRDCWDTQLRTGDGYSGKWEYVRQNPVRAGLTGDTDSWPYQGELNTLYWMGV